MRTYTDVGIMRGWGTWSSLKIEKDNKIKIKVPQSQVNKKTSKKKKSVKNIIKASSQLKMQLIYIKKV